MHKGSLFPLLGAIFSFATTVLIVFTLIGSIKPVAVLEDIYFLKLDSANISTDIVPSLKEMSSDDDNKLHKYDSYTIGLWGYCYSSSNETVGCTDPSTSYHFALVDIIYDTLGYFVTVKSPGNLDDTNTKIQTMSKSLVAIYIVSVGCAFVTLVLGIISIFRNRVVRTITAVLAFIAFAATLVASAVATGLYLYIREQFNKDSSSIPATLGKVGFGISWGATLASLFAFIFASTSMCFARRNAGSSAIPEKQPFLEPAPIDPVPGFSSPQQYQYAPTNSSVSGSGYHNPSVQNHGSTGHPDIFSNYSSYHGHSASMSNEPQFIQPTYYDHQGEARK